MNTVLKMHTHNSMAKPPIAMEGDDWIRSGVIVGARALISKYDGDPDSILYQFGYYPGITQDPERHVSCSRFISMLEYCADKFRTPFFGMELSKHQSIPIFEPVWILMQSASTFRDSILYFMKYMGTHSPFMSFEMSRRDTPDVEFRFLSRIPGLSHKRQGNEDGLSIIFDLFRSIVGSGFRASYIRVAAASPGVILPIQEHFNCNVLYDQAFNAIAFPVGELSRPAAKRNPTLVRILVGYLEGLTLSGEKPIEHQVDRLITLMLPFGDCSLPLVAKRLDRHPRSLQMSLAKKGTEFSRILASRRQVLATAYLKDTRLSLADISGLLGYADQTTFTRAFRTWFGLPPARFRRLKPRGILDS